MGQRRRRAAWIIAGVVLAVALLAALPLYGMRAFRKPIARVTWSYQPSGKTRAGRTYLMPSGGCYAVGFPDQLYFLDAKGQLIKQHSLPQGSNFSIGTLDEQGYLYIGSGMQATMYAFDPNGRKLWTCAIPMQGTRIPPPSNLRYCAPHLNADGNLYVAINSGEFAVLSPDGTIERRFDIGEKINPFDSLVPAPDGGFYLSTDKPDIIRISSSGKILWRTSSRLRRVDQLSSAPDGTVYYTLVRGIFYAYKPDGTKRWDYTNPDPIRKNINRWYGFSMDNDGTVYIASDFRLTAVKPDGTQLWSRTFGEECGPPIITDELLYVQTSRQSIQNLWNNAAMNTRYNYGVSLPYAKDVNYGWLYVVDKRTGDELNCFQLPGGIWLNAGPGTQGEFYGSIRNYDLSNNVMTSTFVRVDLP